jgi:hypothetical protein
MARSEAARKAPDIKYGFLMEMVQFYTIRYDKWTDI